MVKLRKIVCQTVPARPYFVYACVRVWCIFPLVVWGLRPPVKKHKKMGEFLAHGNSSYFTSSLVPLTARHQ